MGSSLPIRLAIFISGTGSNMLALAQSLAHDPHAEVALVLSDVATALGLERAKALGIATHACVRADYPTREAHEHAMLDVLRQDRIERILLAGFMRVLSESFVTTYSDRILNIHPSLLPRHPGLHTHAQVLAQGDAHHGASVHVVTAQLDQGPLLAQGRIRVHPNDSETTLQERVHKVEHVIYPAVVKDWIQGKIVVHNGIASMANHALPMVRDFEEF